MAARRHWWVSVLSLAATLALASVPLPDSVASLRPEQAFAEILAEPASSLDRDREVLLVWNDTEEAPPEAASPEAEELPAAAASVAEVD